MIYVEYTAVDPYIFPTVHEISKNLVSDGIYGSALALCPLFGAIMCFAENIAIVDKNFLLGRDGFQRD